MSAADSPGLTDTDPTDRERVPEPDELTVLVVDDEPVNVLLLEMILKARGFNVAMAEDGAKAVDRVRDGHCDLVLMDVMMPGMDGYDATRHIKRIEAETGRFIPVLFVTALTDEKRLAECVACGGDDFLTKPISRVQLNAKIDSWLRTQAMHRTLQGQHDELERHQQRLDMEQQLARRIVGKAVASPVLETPGLRYRYHPAEILSGDILLAGCTPGGRLMLMLGDFTGHGIAAAIGVIPLSNIFRSMTRKGFSPAEVLREADARMCEALPAEMFLAAITLELDPVSRTLTVWNSAMPPLLVIGRDGTVRHRIGSSQLPLGVDGAHSPGRELPAMLELQAGDRLFLCSDGVVEAGGRQPFGQQQVEQVLTESAPGQGVERLEQALVAHLGHDLPGADDITFVELDCGRLLSELAGCREADGLAAETGPDVRQGEWGCEIRLGAALLRRMNPLPLLLGAVERLHGPVQQRQSVYMVLAELYANALEHGLLGLDSGIKKTEDGFVAYYEMRESRLADLAEGEITFRLRNEGERLVIRVEDDGPGFDYQGLQAWLAENQMQADASDGDDPEAEALVTPAGRGLMLVSALCERLEWQGRGNCVEAVFRW